MSAWGDAIKSLDDQEFNKLFEEALTWKKIQRVDITSSFYTISCTCGFDSNLSGWYENICFEAHRRYGFIVKSLLYWKPSLYIN